MRTQDAAAHSAPGPSSLERVRLVHRHLLSTPVSVLSTKVVQPPRICVSSYRSYLEVRLACEAHRARY